MKNKKNKCLSCKADLSKSGIGYDQMGNMIYSLSVENKELTWEQDEFISEEGGIFFCRNCDNDLDLSEDDVLEILSE